MRYNPLGPWFWKMSAVGILREHEKWIHTDIRRAELKRLGKSEEPTAREEIERIIFKGIILARLSNLHEFRTPGDLPVEIGSKWKCRNTSIYMNRYFDDSPLPSDYLRPGDELVVRDFTFDHDVGWIAQRNNRSDFMFYPLRDFDPVPTEIPAPTT